MTCTANLQMQLGPQLLSTRYEWPQEDLGLEITVECPYCGGETELTGTWGSYPTSTGEVRRYKCKKCNGTFNPAKIPYRRDKVEEFVWKISQMAIKDRVAVNSLAKMWGVPETTLRTLVTVVKDFLASNLEIAKQLQERLSVLDTVKRSDLRIIFYDEGFIKLLGGNGFILFTLNTGGTPINVAIEPQRDGKTIYGYFIQAMTQLGGIDMIVADAAPATLKAAKALRQSLILVQHIHSGRGKRARIIKLEPIPNRKGIWETTVELHTGSLLPNIESKIIAKKITVYPAKWASPTPRKKHHIKKKCLKQDPLNRNGVLTSVEGAGSQSKKQKRKTRFLKGHAIFLRTGANPYEYELNIIPGEVDLNVENCPSLKEIQTMLGIVHQALPKQFITSNRAEVFNALHDRYKVYWGHKTLVHANRDLKAWVAVTFFPEGSCALLRRQRWHVPYRLLVHFLPLMISQVKIS